MEIHSANFEYKKEAVSESMGSKEPARSDTTSKHSIPDSAESVNKNLSTTDQAYLNTVAKGDMETAQDGKLVVLNKNKAEKMLTTIGVQPAEVSNIFNLAKTSLSLYQNNVNKNLSTTDRTYLNAVEKCDIRYSLPDNATVLEIGDAYKNGEHAHRKYVEEVAMIKQMLLL